MRNAWKLITRKKEERESNKLNASLDDRIKNERERNTKTLVNRNLCAKSIFSLGAHSRLQLNSLWQQQQRINKNGVRRKISNSEVCFLVIDFAFYFSFSLLSRNNNKQYFTGCWAHEFIQFFFGSKSRSRRDRAWFRRIMRREIITIVVCFCVSSA